MERHLHMRSYFAKHLVNLIKAFTKNRKDWVSNMSNYWFLVSTVAEVLILVYLFFSPPVLPSIEHLSRPVLHQPVRNSSSNELQQMQKKVEEHMRVQRVWGRWLKHMCFALMNTSPRISEDRVPTISRVANGQWSCQWSAEVTDNRGGMEEFMGSIQCDIWTEELPPQCAEVIYYDSRYVA